MDRGSQLDEEEEEADEEAEDEEEKEKEEKEEEERKATDIKSNNPHLAGGEIYIHILISQISDKIMITTHQYIYI